MPQTRKISAKEFVGDIRAGLTEKQLMDKYGLPRKAMEDIFVKLVKSEAIRPSELPAPTVAQPVRYDEVELIAARSSPRYSLEKLDIRVSDADDESASGDALDISEGGIAVRGICGEVGESKSLVILCRPDHVELPIALDAECRWVRADNRSGETVCGYEITLISEDDLERFQELVQLAKKHGPGLGFQ